MGEHHHTAIFGIEELHDSIVVDDADVSSLVEDPNNGK